MYVLIIATLMGGSVQGWNVTKQEGFTTKAACDTAGAQVSALSDRYYPIKFTCLNRNP
jgi:hypothetical protein